MLSRTPSYGQQIALLAIALTGTPLAAEVRYHVAIIPDLPGGEANHCKPRGINNLGEVCGDGTINCVLGPNVYEAMLYSPAPSFRLLDLGTLPGCAENACGSSAYAINDLGHVVGVDDGTGCDVEGFFWSPETGMIGLGALRPAPYFYSWAHAINNYDQVVGITFGQSAQEAFLWQPGVGMVGLGHIPGGPCATSAAYGINDAGWITGWTCSPNGSEAFLWTPQGGMIGIGGGGGAAINNLGQIVGGTGLQAFLWDPFEGMTLLGYFFNVWEESTWATDVNDRGEVVGIIDAYTSLGIVRPFIWDARRGMRNLWALLDPCTPPSLRHPLPPSAINNAGQIVAESASLWVPALLLTPYVPGDLSDDSTVDLVDLTRLLAGFGMQENAVYTDGDLDCDGDVDLRDLTTLLSNFGETYP